MYRWYLLGCRLRENPPVTREEFAEQHLLELIGGDLLASSVFDRTDAEWELDREDACWTEILQRLRNMNLTHVTSDLVAAIQRGRDADEDGPAGDAGAPARRPPFLPTRAGAAAHEPPGSEPDPCEVISAGPGNGGLGWQPRYGAPGYP
jgi:hypothetical protein